MDNESKTKSLSYYHCTRGTCNGKECEVCLYAKVDDAVLAMAEWKDQEFARQKQSLIEKACEWLKDNTDDFLEFGNYTDDSSGVSFDIDSLTDNFRKAMEGE